MRALVTCVLAVAVAVASSFVLGLLPAVETATLAARAQLGAAFFDAGMRAIDERIVAVDVRSPQDPERLADVVELALANGARAIALIATPSAPNERLSAALADCQCVVVPEGHPLAPVSAQRGHVMVHTDDDEPVPRIVLTGKDAGASGAALALALSRAAGTPATLEGRADALVRLRPSLRVVSLDDVITPRIDLARTFRAPSGASLVLVGDVNGDALALHASLLHDLMHGRLLDAPPLSFTLVVSGFVALLLCGLAGVLLARRRMLAAVILAAVLELAWWANATAALAIDDVWLPVAAPTCALTLALVIALLRRPPPPPPTGSPDDDADEEPPLHDDE
jgi:CHASE2 domain-containing sensor protein